MRPETTGSPRPSSPSSSEEPAGAQRHQNGEGESPATPVAEERQWGVPFPVVVVVGALEESLSSRGWGSGRLRTPRPSGRPDPASLLVVARDSMGMVSAGEVEVDPRAAGAADPAAVEADLIWGR